jgi:hypothetical protein
MGLRRTNQQLIKRVEEELDVKPLRQVGRGSSRQQLVELAPRRVGT